MTSKTLNIIMLVCLILFSVIFGVAATLKAEEFRRLDEAYEDEVQDNLEKENESILDDLNTQNKNEQINNGSNSTTNSDENNTNGGVVNFSDFITMFNYAENKLNNSTNILLQMVLACLMVQQTKVDTPLTTTKLMLVLLEHKTAGKNILHTTLMEELWTTFTV